MSSRVVRGQERSASDASLNRQQTPNFLSSLRDIADDLIEPSGGVSVCTKNSLLGNRLYPMAV